MTSSVDALKARFGLDYPIHALQTFVEWAGLRGKHVLEVGGALPEALVRDHYGASTWVCVDDVTTYNETKRGDSRDLASGDDPVQAAAWVPQTWHRYEGAIQDLPRAMDGRFDVVISVAALEHMHRLPQALDRIRDALKPGGLFCAMVGPIWSGWQGHHIFPHYFPEDPPRTARLLAMLRPWAHVAWGRPQMYAALQRTFGAAFAQRVVYSIYESPRLNRLFADEYLAHFAAHGFAAEHMDGWTTSAPEDRALLAQAQGRHPAQGHFEWEGFTCCLSRQARSFASGSEA